MKHEIDKRTENAVIYASTTETEVKGGAGEGEVDPGIGSERRKHINTVRQEAKNFFEI
jgi:hypothetical protein